MRLRLFALFVLLVTLLAAYPAAAHLPTAGPATRFGSVGETAPFPAPVPTATTNRATAGLWSAETAAPTSDQAWDTTLGNPGPSDYVVTLEVADDWLYVGGRFFAVAGFLGYGYVARWNLRSQQWESLGGGVGGGSYNGVNTTMVSPDGRYVFVGGKFDTVYNGFNRQDPISTGDNPNLARWDNLNRTWQVFQTTETLLVSNEVRSFAILDGHLYVGGWSLGNSDPGDPQNQTMGLVRWSGDPFTETLTGEWEGVGGGIVYNEGVDPLWWNNVYVLEPLPDNRLLVGGGFSQVADAVGDPPITVNRIAAWDPATGHWSGFGDGVWEIVYTADVSGGTITVGGGKAVIATCTSGGCTLLGGGLGEQDSPNQRNDIFALENLGGTLYAGGSFNRADHNSPADYIAQLEGGQWVELGGGTDRRIYALATDGRYLYVGGCMHQVGSKPSLYLARWDTEGGVDSPWAIQDVAVAEYVLGTPLGSWSSLALDAVGHPHISYFDGGPDDLLYASWTGSRWVTETVDGAGNTGHYAALALDAADNPHVSYYNYSDDCLHHARRASGQWISSTVDCASDITEFQYSSVALDANGYPHISYRYVDTENVVSQLRYARWDGAQWLTQTVASGFMDTGIGIDPSLALDSAGHPHITYVDVNWSVGTLQYAYWDGSQWVLETIDDSGQAGGSNSGRLVRTSLVLDDAGYPHVSYYNATNGDPMYAYQDGSGWHSEVISDSADVMGWSNSLALDSNGNPHVSFYNATKKILQYANKTSATWEVGTVDAEGDVGGFSSLDLDAYGNRHISYYFKLNPNNGLRHASLRSENPNSGEVSGPPLAEPGSPVHLEAVANLPGATLPITFTWEVSGEEPPTGTILLRAVQAEPIVHVVDGFTDSLTLTWDQMGTYQVNVSMVSRNGLGAVAVFEVIIADLWSVCLPLVMRGR